MEERTKMIDKRFTNEELNSMRRHYVSDDYFLPIGYTIDYSQGEEKYMFDLEFDRQALIHMPFREIKIIPSIIHLKAKKLRYQLSREEFEVLTGND